MSNRVSRDKAEPTGTINFGIGQPSADLLPVELIRTAADDYLRRAQAEELNYGEKQGDPRFRNVLAGFLSQGYCAHQKQDPDRTPTPCWQKGTGAGAYSVWL